MSVGERTMSGKVLVRLGLVLGSAVAGLLLAQLAAAAWLHFLASEEEFRHYATWEAVQARAQREGRPAARFKPHRYIGFIPAPNFRDGEDEHDGLGFRGRPFPVRKPPGEFRIFCMGGSTTYTSMVGEAEGAYPALLEKALHERGYGQVRVINAGAPGYTTYETLISFQLRIADLDPDLLVVYHGVNDVITRMVWPPGAYRGDNSGHIGPGGGWFVTTPLLERFALARIVLLRLNRIRSAEDLMGQVGTLPGTARFWQFAGQQMKGTYPEEIFEEVPAIEMLRTNEPVYFRRNLELLLAGARLRGVGVVLATFAVSKEKGDLFSSTAMMYGIEEQNEILKELGAEFDVPVFDYAAVAPTGAELYWDGVHVGPEGARIKADQFAEFLALHVLPPPVARAADRFAASGEVLLSLLPGGGLSGIEAQGDATVSPGADSLRVAASGPDPRLRLPAFDSPAGKHVILRIQLSSPATTDLQVFFVTPGARGYAEDRSIRVPIDEGWNDVHVLLQEPVTGRLRVDPGLVEGEYRVRGIEARTVPAP